MVTDEVVVEATTFAEAAAPSDQRRVAIDAWRRSEGRRGEKALRTAGGGSDEGRREGNWIGEWDQWLARDGSVGKIAGKSGWRGAMG